MSLLDFDKEARSLISESLSRNPGNRHKKDIFSESSLPILAKTSTWETLENPERLFKTFSFNDFRQQLDFINEFMIYQEKMNHHGLIKIDHNAISIALYTKDINSVTEIDLSLSEFADILYKDVMYYYNAENVDNEKYL